MNAVVGPKSVDPSCHAVRKPKEIIKDASFIQMVAETSELCFLSVAHEVGNAGDAKGMFLIMSHLKKKGFPGPISKNDSLLFVQSPAGKKSLRLSDSVLSSLQFPETSSFLLNIFASLHDRSHESSRTLLNDLLFRSAFLRRGDVVDQLLALGADPNQKHSSRMALEAKAQPAFIECLLHGNSEQALAYALIGDKSISNQIVEAISGQKLFSRPSGTYDEAGALIKNSLKKDKVDCYLSIFNLMQALDGVVDRSEVNAARARLVVAYFSLMREAALEGKGGAYVELLMGHETGRERKAPLHVRMEEMGRKSQIDELLKIADSIRHSCGNHNL